MQKSSIIALVLLGGGVAWAGSGLFGGKPKSAIEFSRAALPPPASVDVRAAASVTHVVLPVDLGLLAPRADQTLPDMLAAVRDYLPDAACGQHRGTLECVNAKLDGSVTRNGAVALDVSQSMIKLSIPVKYTLSAVGNGWASAMGEHKSGESRVELDFAISVNAAGALDVTRREPSAAEDVVGLLKANIKVSHLIEAQLRPVARAAEDDLRRILAGLPVKTAVARVWDAVAQPFELGRGSGLWLRSSPDYYTNGTFVSEAGHLSYQIPIASHLAIVETDKGQTNNAKRTAMLSQEAAPSGPSLVRMAVPINLDAMRAEADAAFKGQVFESRADRFSEPVKVKVRATHVYPALHQIGLALDVDVTPPKGSTYSGTLNLAGRPVLDTSAGLVTLADVTFPAVSSKDANGQRPDVPRLGTEPFAERFATVAKLDIASALAEALPRAKQMLNQQVGADLQMRAVLAQAVPVALELSRDGAFLMVDLTGDVSVAYSGASEPVDIPSLAPIRSSEQRPVPMPTVTVVAAPAVAALAAAAMVSPSKPTAKPHVAVKAHADAQALAKPQLAAKRPVPHVVTENRQVQSRPTSAATKHTPYIPGAI